MRSNLIGICRLKLTMLPKKLQRVWVYAVVITCWTFLVWKYDRKCNIRIVEDLQSVRIREGHFYQSGAAYLANHVSVKVSIVHPTIHEITLINSGNYALYNDGWSIYFNHLFEVHLFDSDCGFSLETVDGTLKKLTPQDNFTEIPSGHRMTLKFRSSSKTLRHFIFPRWYTVGEDGEAFIIRNTDDEDLEFVSTVNKAELRNDLSSIFSPHERYEKYSTMDLKTSPLRVIPSPIKSTLERSKWIEIIREHWVICSSVFYSEAEFIADTFGIHQESVSSECPPSNYILFTRAQISEQPHNNESYKLEINQDGYIEITALTDSGAFYAVQTIFSIAETDHENMVIKLPVGRIVDWPRFPYRGLLVDVARNFVKPKDLIKLIQVMSMYKLNKLHLHLTDDDGWRLEIMGLPELTQVGSIRQHKCEKTNKDSCLNPSLGSGPFSNTSGSGYYTTSQYRRILIEAARHHVTVIPEIDLPAHSLAAITAMRARYHSFMALKEEEKAKEFLLSDFYDESEAYSPQGSRNTAVNPCMDSTFKFTAHIIQSLVNLHLDIQPLKIFHLGGDEVHSNSWSKSPACNRVKIRIKKYKGKQLQQHFFSRAWDYFDMLRIQSIGVWGDALFESASSDLLTKSYNGKVMDNFIIYDWISTSQQKKKLYENNYKIVLANPSYFYFDHPTEPDPNEFGLTWATPNVDDKKIFFFTPQQETFQNNRELLQKNVIGMEANMWGELTRSIKIIHHQLFPRLLSFAERAWHEPPWEKTLDRNAMKKDWTEFANTVTYKEFAKLKERRIFYRIPPPGVKVKNNVLYLSTMYPGLKVLCKPDTPSADWEECRNGERFEDDDPRTEFVTEDGSRRSRVVSIKNT